MTAAAWSSGRLLYFQICSSILSTLKGLYLGKVLLQKLYLTDFFYTMKQEGMIANTTKASKYM
ncbi:hypothetical protein A3Q35_02145 [Aeribacillus pallidus]|nr:hypothetical protein A3Q35_02145 [Aeribacillus pallidus]